MNYSRTLRFVFAAALVLGFSSAAFAQATRTWVSGVGDDANPCSRTAPCKTFAGAISKTATLGEISVLDPGGFGAVTITKSITINGTGTLAGILSAGSPGAVTVNDALAAVPNSAVVIIREVSMNGAGSGTSGVRYLSGKTVVVDHCWIYGMTSRGIDVAKTSEGFLKVIDTVIENVSEDGVHMTTGAGIVTALIDRSRIMNSGQDGVEAVSNVRLLLSNSMVFRAGAIGVQTTGSNSQLNVDDTWVAHCETFGLRSNAGSNIRVSDSTIANNTTGISANGGTIDSFQGNSLIGNPTPGTFTTTTQKQ